MSPLIKLEYPGDLVLRVVEDLLLPLLVLALAERTGPSAGAAAGTIEKSSDTVTGVGSLLTTVVKVIRGGASNNEGRPSSKRSGSPLNLPDDGSRRNFSKVITGMSSTRL